MDGKDIVKRPSYPPVPVQLEPVSEAAIPRAFRAAKRNRHLTIPLAVPPAVWTAGEILHAVHAAPVTAAVGGTAAVVVWWFAPHKWERAPEAWYARLSVLGLALWESLAAELGADRGLAGVILASTLLAVSAVWGFIWWRHYRPRDRRRREKMIAHWDAWWQGHAHKWALAGSRVIDAHETKVTVRIRVQLMPGSQSVSTVKQAVHLIETALEGMVETGRVRVQGAKNPSQVDLFFKRDNPLREPVEWDPALAPRSVHEEAVDGLSETGKWVTTPMRINAFVIGRTRSGKSNHLLVRVAQLSGCADDRQVVIDLKGGRSGRPLIETGAVDYVITEVGEARMYLLMLTKEVAARAKGAYTGEEQLEATPEIPAIHTLVDETRGLTSQTAGDADCRRLAADIATLGSGLEAYVEFYTQYGSLEESVGTDVIRMNLAVRAVYAVEEPRHGAFAIAEFAKFDASKLEEKGTHLLKAGPEAHTEQIRAPKMPHRLLKEITAANTERLADRPPLRLYCGDQQSPLGMTWQEWWDRRWLRLDPAFHRISPQYQEAVALYGTEQQETVQDDVPARSVTDPEASPAVIIGSDARTVAARIAAETSGPDWTPDRRTAARLGGVVRGEKEAFADALQAATGQNPVSPRQLQDESGRGHSWVHGKLISLSERGAVIKVGRGLYAAAPGADIAREIAAIDAGTDQMLKAAQKVNRELAGRQ